MGFLRTLFIILFISSFSIEVWSQSCGATGCLGPNLVQDPGFENFNPANPFAFFSTDYDHGGPCTGPFNNSCGGVLCQGDFAVGTSANPCNSGWSPLIADHTLGDGTGNFMIIDFDPALTQNIWCQTIMLEPNRDYCFGGWFINIVPAGDNLPEPVLRFEVDGAFVGFSGNIPENEQWSFEGVTINSGAGGLAEFCILNENTGMIGFDLGIDDISVREVDPNGGPLTVNDIGRVCSPTEPVTVNVTGNDSPNGSPIDPSSLAIFTGPPFSEGSISNIDPANGTITFQPFGSNFTSSSFQYTICDNAGCCQVATVDITINPDIQLSTTGDNLTCATAGMGSVSVTASGGSPPYTYDWDNASDVQSPTGLDVGIYTVTVSDIFGCTEVATAEITGPPNVDITLQATNVTCFGDGDGSINMQINSGSPPFNFDWDNAPDVQNPTGLSPGMYTVTVTDNNACSETATINITEPDELLASIQLVNGVSCNGDSDGAAMADALQGTPPYTYTWNDASTDQSRNDLPGGLATITVTDNNGCQATADVTIPEPAILEITVTGSDALCLGVDDGTASASSIGGTGPYTYDWSTAETGTSINGLAPGQYDVTVTDANGCVDEGGVALVEMSPFLADIQVGDATCSGVDNGTATVTPTSGLAPFTFLFDNGETTNPAMALSGGPHSVFVQDNQGCELTLDFVISLGTTLTLDAVNVTDVSCTGGIDGTASAQISGGQAPYTYFWDADPSQTNATINGLSAGSYTVSVEDVNGCTSNILSFTVGEPAPLGIDLMIEMPSCTGDSDGSIQPVLAGGFPPYTFEWNTGETTDSIGGLATGRYMLTITDANNCITEIDTFLNEPMSLVAGVRGIDISCFGNQDGIIQIDSTVGGTTPYLYSLNGEDFQLGPIFTGLLEGDYEITIEDANGCGITREASISEPFELILTLGEDLDMELGDSTRLNAQVNTTAPLSYSWDPPLFLSCSDCPDPFLKPLQSVLYTLTALDSNGCEVSDELRVNLRKSFDFFIPNAFSPNNDGVNDVFMIFGSKSVNQVLQFQVFSRWGENVWDARNFQPDDPSFGWDGLLNGKALHPGVFVYFAEVEFIDGTVVPFKGDVTLIR